MALRRLVKPLRILIAALVLTATGLVASASPAAASYSYNFSGSNGFAWGTITFTSSYQATVAGHIYGQSNSPSYMIAAKWFGTGTYRCWTTKHNNSMEDYQRNYTDYPVCYTANIQQIEILYFTGDTYISSQYFDNPYA